MGYGEETNDKKSGKGEGEGTPARIRKQVNGACMLGRR